MLRDLLQVDESEKATEMSDSEILIFGVVVLVLFVVGLFLEARSE